jgi:hypothetical protein
MGVNDMDKYIMSMETSNNQRWKGTMVFDGTLARLGIAAKPSDAIAAIYSKKQAIAATSALFDDPMDSYDMATIKIQRQ